MIISTFHSFGGHNSVISSLEPTGTREKSKMITKPAIPAAAEGYISLRIEVISSEESSRDRAVARRWLKNTL